MASVSKDTSDLLEIRHAHAVSFLKLDLREHRTCEMTVSAEECLYMRAHLGWVRKAERNQMYA